jgi:hypothetical protein
MSVPFHKQLDPVKQAGQVVNPIPEQYLHQYIERKTDEPKKMTFKEWLKKSSFVEPDETVYCWLEECWNSAIKHGKIS